MTGVRGPLKANLLTFPQEPVPDPGPGGQELATTDTHGELATVDTVSDDGVRQDTPRTWNESQASERLR